MKIQIELTDEQVAQVSKEAITAQANAAAVIAVTGLRPGQMVVDVGGGSDDGIYTGPENPDAMTPYDWAFYAQHPALWAKAGAIFSSKPILRDKDTGRMLHQGDLADVVDTTQYAANGGVLAKYL